MLVLVVAAQALRWWCIVSLGPRWNTRVVIVPGLPRVTRGPYRWLAHPNYVAVVVEGFALPLVGSAWVTALCFTTLNAVLLTVRIRTENAALSLLPRPVIDLIVAGGGPVGLATAITAALADLEVVVVEPRDGPIDKACGEGLMPDAVARLNALGVDPAGVDIAGIRYLSGSRTAEARFTAGPGRGVRRTRAARRDEAPRAGGRRQDRARPGDRRGAVRRLRRAAGLRSRYLVGADGLHSAVRRAIGLAARPVAGARRFGVRQHFEVAPWTDLVEVYWLPDREVYVTPVGPNCVGVAVLGRGPLDLPSAISGLPALAARLAGAPAVQRATGRRPAPAGHDRPGRGPGAAGGGRGRLRRRADRRGAADRLRRGRGGGRGDPARPARRTTRASGGGSPARTGRRRMPCCGSAPVRHGR